MKKLIIATAIVSASLTANAFAEGGNKEAIVSGVSNTIIALNAENENVANWFKADVTGDNEAKYEASQAIVEDFKNGEFTEQQIEAMKSYSPASGDGESFASYVAQGAVLGMTDEEYAQAQQNNPELANMSKEEAANAAYAKVAENNPNEVTKPENIRGALARAEEIIGKSVGERVQERSTERSYDRREQASDSLANALEQQAIGEEYQDRVDGVMAGSHAVANARPMLSQEGDTAVGVGVGYAGDTGAVAIGVGHSFNEDWSASATVNATTGDYAEVSAGGGVQYVF
ncbi:YadA C-terminal domain-containing protein [Vibrio gallicus]|uniref:YadA C-terminal domain-containing protein n=1 Tax=Vibrio gallicus TaxID=190897 RepID=UPI0021C403F4|nr:YadA C-terminal domain-containing protein [Vibrio gallicus]